MSDSSESDNTDINTVIVAGLVVGSFGLLLALSQGGYGFVPLFAIGLLYFAYVYRYRPWTE